MKVSLYRHSAVASHTCVVKGLKLRIAVVGEENLEKGLWFEARIDKLPFYNNLPALLGFGKSWLPGGEYDEKLMLRFDDQFYGLADNIFEILEEDHSQALASESETKTKK